MRAHWVPLAALLAACSTDDASSLLGGGSAGNDAAQDGGAPLAPAACGATADVGPSQILRLSKTQYLNALTDIFGQAVVSQLGASVTLIPDDDVATNPAALTMVSADQVSGYMAVASALAQAVTSSNAASAVFGSCAVAPAPSASCVDTYLTTTAKRIFRRELTPAEIQQAEAMVSAGTGTYLQNLGALLTYHLQTPWFINRIELGAAPADDAASFTLTPFEVATRIAFETTDSTPDAALFDAASGHQLATRAQLEAQARRLFATERGKAKVRAIIHQYVGNPSTSDLTVLPPALLSDLRDPASLSTAMFAELDQFIDYIVWEKNGSLADLLTSRASFATNPDLASIYGHPPADPNRAAGSPTATFSGRRAGILMRLPLLASAGPRTRLPHRGVNVLRNVLCTTVPDPSAATMAMIAALSPTPEQLEGMTTRQYLETVTASGACHSCHQMINPVGFAFENFGPTGRLRTTEAIFSTNNQSGTHVTDLPIDTAAEVNVGTADFKVTDALDLVTQIASSGVVVDCFARRAFRSVQERPEASNDACTLAEIGGQLTKTNASILDALVTAVASDSTPLHRKPQ